MDGSASHRPGDGRAAVPVSVQAGGADELCLYGMERSGGGTWDPSTLYLCRDESYDLFEDLAQKLGVKIKRVKRLPAAERILRDLGAV